MSLYWNKVFELFDDDQYFPVVSGSEDKFGATSVAVENLFQFSGTKQTQTSITIAQQVQEAVDGNKQGYGGIVVSTEIAPNVVGSKGASGDIILVTEPDFDSDGVPTQAEFGELTVLQTLGLQVSGSHYIDRSFRANPKRGDAWYILAVDTVYTVVDSWVAGGTLYVKYQQTDMSKLRNPIAKIVTREKWLNLTKSAYPLE